jgi:hypothetical protein
MKAHVEVFGDRSVGIQPMHFDTQVPLNPTDSIDDREDLRKRYEDFLRQEWDDLVLVTFEDECPECRSRKVEGKEQCSNPHCISNEPVEN